MTFAFGGRCSVLLSYIQTSFLAGKAGFEPATLRLTAECSAFELLANMVHRTGLEPVCPLVDTSPSSWRVCRFRHLRISMVHTAGVEPARFCNHWFLKPARLPIPPRVHVVNHTFKIIACFFRFVYNLVIIFVDLRQEMSLHSRIRFPPGNISRRIIGSLMKEPPPVRAKVLFFIIPTIGVLGSPRWCA